MKRSNKPAWQIDELAQAGAEHLDPGYVATYDRKAGFDPAPDLTLLQDLGLGRESTLVDFGAGTGSLALAAASHCRKVIALDPSPAMTAAISRAVAARGVMNLEVIQEGLLTYEHKGLPVDFAFSRNAFHHLPDFWKGLALFRVASILRRGGVLRLRDIVFSFEPGEAKPHIEAWLGSAAKRPEDGWTSEELAAHVRDEYSTFAWLLEPMLVHAASQSRRPGTASQRSLPPTSAARDDAEPTRLPASGARFEAFRQHADHVERHRERDTRRAAQLLRSARR